MATKERVDPFSVRETDVALQQMDHRKASNLVQVVRSVNTMDRATKDIEVPLADLKFKVGRFPTGIGVVHRKTTYGLTPWAMSQMCNRMEIPASYLWKLYRREQHKLLLSNIQTMQRMHDDQTLLLRTVPSNVSSYKPIIIGEKNPWKGKLIRGVLTPSFTATDNTMILDVLKDYLPNGFNITEWQVTNDGMVCRIVDTKGKTKIKEGSKVGALYVGMVISNSEVGKGSVSIEIFVYRLICTNGMVIPRKVAGFKRRHLGEARDEFETQLQETLAQLPEISEEIGDGTERLRKARWNEESALLRIETALGNRDHGKPIVGLFDGGKKEATEAVMAIMQTEAKRTNNRLTRWGFLNAFTSLAQRLPTDRRTAIEIWAGGMLFSSRN